MSAINAEEGVVDKLNLRFQDYFTPKLMAYGDKVVPYLWEYQGEISWYIAPSKLEMAGLADAACEYVSLFEQTQTQEFTMRM